MTTPKKEPRRTLSARRPACFILISAIYALSAVPVISQARPRARDLGIVVGVYPSGPRNAITDVAGVKVGHTTMVDGDRVRTA